MADIFRKRIFLEKYIFVISIVNQLNIKFQTSYVSLAQVVAVQPEVHESWEYLLITRMIKRVRGVGVNRRAGNDDAVATIH